MALDWRYVVWLLVVAKGLVYEWRGSQSARPVVSDREIDMMCAKRARLRQMQRYEEADAILGKLFELDVRVRDNVDWSWTWNRVRQNDMPDILQLGKQARRCTLSTESDEKWRQCIADKSKRALTALQSPKWVTRHDLPGRKAADAAFAFATAGCEDEELFELLADSACEEQQRGALHVHAVEKLAAAGVRLNHSVFSGTSDNGVFLARRGAVWRWRYSKSKEARAITSVVSCEDAMWAEPFADMTLPLVVDLGSGMGKSALGLASQGLVNVLGVDASAACSRPANAAAKRLGYQRNCRFVRADANDAMRWVIKHYPGPTKAVLLQFPTPFIRGDVKTAVRGGAFMLTESLLSLVVSALVSETAYFYFASNVEDVAVYALNACKAAGLHPVSDAGVAASFLDHAQQVKYSEGDEDRCKCSVRMESRRRRIPLREQRWASDRRNARAIGPVWLTKSPLPPTAQTETEVFYLDMKQPVYRLLFTNYADHCALLHD